MDNDNIYIEKSSGTLWKLYNINCVPYYPTTYSLRLISDSENYTNIEIEVDIEELHRRFKITKINLVTKENYSNGITSKS